MYALYTYIHIYIYTPPVTYLVVPFRYRIQVKRAEGGSICLRARPCAQPIEAITHNSRMCLKPTKGKSLARGNDTYPCASACIYLYKYVCIYICKERERERETERKTLTEYMVHGF